MFLAEAVESLLAADGPNWTSRRSIAALAPWKDVFRRASDPPPLSREEWNALLAMIMSMDWKLDQIMEELEIDDGQETD